MAWEKVMRPLELGGLGIHNLEVMGWALQMRWLWIEKNQIRSTLGWSRNPYSHTHFCYVCNIIPLLETGRIPYFGLIAGNMDNVWKSWHQMFISVFLQRCEEQEPWLRLFMSELIG
jgi:hypothetical protein